MSSQFEVKNKRRQEGRKRVGGSSFREARAIRRSLPNGAFGKAAPGLYNAAVVGTSGIKR